MKKISKLLRKCLKSPLIALCGAVMITFGCTTIRYVPIKGETIVKDSIIIETRIDTFKVQLPPERVRDYTGLLDTLVLETSLASSKTWIDTTSGNLKGELVNKEKPVDVVVPSTSVLEKKDSIIYRDVPVPVEIEKEIKIYPKWMIILSILGVFSTCVLGMIGYLKMRGKR